MLEKLQAIEDRYEHLAQLLSDPAVIAEQAEWKKHAREHAHLSELVEKFRQYKAILRDLEEARGLQREKLDDEFRALVDQEVGELKGRQ